MKTGKKTPEPHIEICAFCGQEFDVNKRDNSGYLHGKPVCVARREDVGDYI